MNITSTRLPQSPASSQSFQAPSQGVDLQDLPGDSVSFTSQEGLDLMHTGIRFGLGGSAGMTAGLLTGANPFILGGIGMFTGWGLDNPKGAMAAAGAATLLMGVSSAVFGASAQSLATAGVIGAFLGTFGEKFVTAAADAGRR